MKNLLKNLTSVRQNSVRTSRDFTVLLLVFVWIMPDNVSWDQKKSCLVNFEYFHFFFIYSLMANFWKKSKKNENFQNWPNMTLCEIIDIKKRKTIKDFRNKLDDLYKISPRLFLRTSKIAWPYRPCPDFGKRWFK